jgi:hypothetical protein
VPGPVPVPVPMLMLVLVLVIGGERVDEVPCLICPRTGSGGNEVPCTRGLFSQSIGGLVSHIPSQAT